jgi:subtilisin family serine protease
MALATVAVACTLPSTAWAGLHVSGDRAAAVPGEVIVKFKAGVSAADRRDVASDRNARGERSLPVPRAALFDLPAGAATGPAIAALERDPRVAWAEPNAYRVAAAQPNDPFFAQQWSLRNSGQTVQGVAGAAGADIDAPEAWDLTTGSPDVKVAVVDSGINFDQPDVAANVWHNPGESGSGRESNGVDDDGNGFVDDWRGWDFVQQDNDPSDNFGHGTHVAGILAARGNDGLGVAGLAWHASLIPVRVLGNANLGTCTQIASGLAYAVRAGARIVNVSLGDGPPCQLERDVIDGAPNVLFVFSAGNRGVDLDASPSYPCSYPSPNIVCVAATDSADRLASFSNYGARPVDLAAPGVSVLNAYVKWGPTDEVFGDDFETPLTGRWITGGTPDTWTRTPFVETHSGGFSLSNSQLGSYQNNTDNWAQLVQGLNLSGRRDCAATIWMKKSLGPLDPSQPLGGLDALIADPSPDGVHWGSNLTAQAGTNAAFEKWLIDLAPLDERATGSLRFHLHSDGSGTYGGVALDDLRVFCVPPLTRYTGAADEFAYDFGTSMAAPHVSGVAVLLLSLDPGLTAAQLKARLLATVDPLPSLAGKTVSGGRLNAARALGALGAAGRGGSSPSRAAVASPSRAAMASVLAAQARAIAKALRKIGSRGLLRRGGLFGVRPFAPAAGRLTLELRSAAHRTVAAGSCSVPRAGRCGPRARLTRGGRRLLRHAAHPRLTVLLAFAPGSGAPLTRRAAVTLGRLPSKSR